MARYGQSFKDKALARLLAPESAALHVVAQELGLGVSTLERWREQAQSRPARVPGWTAGSRLEAVITTAALNEAAKSAWCREHGAYLAQIGLTIESWVNGYDTPVGEGGVQMSGGQRQRIGIAPALYKKADVFIFDEATSALDNATEEAVMRSIESLDERITMLIIAHCLSTLKNCDEIIEFHRQTAVNAAVPEIGAAPAP